MSQTKAGAKKAVRLIKERYGNDHYAKIGAVGGKLGHTGGFYGDPALARRAGALGGRISKRPPGKTPPRRHPIIIPPKPTLLRKLRSALHV